MWTRWMLLGLIGAGSLVVVFVVISVTFAPSVHVETPAPVIETLPGYDATIDTHYQAKGRLLAPGGQ